MVVFIEVNTKIACKKKMYFVKCIGIVRTRSRSGRRPTEGREPGAGAKSGSATEAGGRTLAEPRAESFID